MIFINFKTYKQGSGISAMMLEKTITDVATEANVKIIPVVQASDVREAVSGSRLEVWTQHVDAISYGAHTGYILPEAVAEDGAAGTFLNHSEHKFASFSDLSAAHTRAKEAKLSTLIFATDIKELENIIILNPDYVAYEPADLVGSKTESVATSKPEIIFQAAEVAKRYGKKLIVGAGIKSSQDIKRSLELGAFGFAVASDIVTAENPREELLELIGGFKK